MLYRCDSEENRQQVAREAWYARDIIRDTGIVIGKHPDSPIFVNVEDSLISCISAVHSIETLWGRFLPR